MPPTKVNGRSVVLPITARSQVSGHARGFRWFAQGVVLGAIAGCQVGCVVVGNSGGKVSFKAYRVADDYELPNPKDAHSWEYPRPRMDQLSPASDTVLVLFFRDLPHRDRFEIVGAYRLGRQGRRIRYPLRPFVLAFSSKFTVTEAGAKEIGVIAFSKDCWPAMYVSGDIWVSQRGGIVYKVDETADFKVPFGCRARTRIILVPRHRPFEPIAVCTGTNHVDGLVDTSGLSQLLVDARGKMANAIARSHELTDSDRSMVLSQTRELLETLIVKGT